MKTAYRSLHWFVIGMGHVLGLSPQVMPMSEGGPMDAIGRDFRSVGEDFRAVMSRTPATPETALQLGEKAAQLELIAR
jgi:hypothetical protein